MKVRIQKYLSQSGILSRRKAEECLKQGLIKVNGVVVTELGTKIDPRIDRVELDPIIHVQRENRTTIAFHKPRGIVTNLPRNHEKQITDLLPPDMKHLNSIGRLDKHSEGLILLTDDGIVAKNLLSSQHERDYFVWTDIPLSPDAQNRLEAGIRVPQKGDKPGFTSLPCKIVRFEDNPNKFKITLTEGKNRQVRRMIAVAGAHVVRLKRVRFGSARLGDLKPGQFRVVNPSELVGPIS